MNLDQLQTDVVARLAAHLIIPALLMGGTFLAMVLWRTDLAVQNLIWTPSDSVSAAVSAVVIGAWAWGVGWAVPIPQADKRGCGARSGLRRTVQWGAGVWLLAAALLALRGATGPAPWALGVAGNVVVALSAFHMILTVQYARRLGRWMQLTILDRAAFALLGLPLLVGLLLLTMGVQGSESAYAALKLCQIVAVVVAWVLGVNAFHTFMHALEARSRDIRRSERARE